MGASELLSIDPTMKIELSFLASSAPAAVDAFVRKEVLNQLPGTDAKPTTLTQCLLALQALQEREVLRFASGLVHDQVSSVIDMVSRMTKHVSPKFDKGQHVQQSHFFIDVTVKLQNFLCIEDPTDAEDPPLRQGRIDQQVHSDAGQDGRR